MLDLLLTYWPVLLLLHVPKLAQGVAVVIARRVKGTLDRRIPDDLPMTAGEWLAARLAALRLGVDAVVTDKYQDAYRPRDRVIHLHDTTHFKADPVAWATAAHELGHARIRAEYRVIGWLRVASIALASPLLGAGIAALASYMLYAIPLGGHLAFACFAGAAALRGFVLLDEAASSILAYRELRAADAIDFAHLRAIRAVLVTTFLTYLVTTASYALLLAQWSLLDGLVVPVARAELTDLGSLAAIVLTLAWLAAWRFRRGFLHWVPIVLLLPLVWNVVEPAYTWCVLAAVFATADAWHRIALLPFGVPSGVLQLLLDKLAGPGVDKTLDYRCRRERGEGAVAAGNARIDALVVRWALKPHPSERAWSVVRLASLPLLVAIWL